MVLDFSLYKQLIAAASRERRKRLLVLAAVLFTLGLVAIYWGLQKEEQVSITPLSQEIAQTPAGVKIAAEAAQIPLSKAQTRETARKISQAAAKPPEQFLQSTGYEVPKVIGRSQKETGADFTILTNRDNPKEKPVLKPEETVNLNIYNIKAYPKRLAEISLGMKGADLAYLYRVDVPKVPLLLPKGAVSYAGPFIRSEYNGGRVDGGIRLVMTF